MHAHVASFEQCSWRSPPCRTRPSRRSSGGLVFTQPPTDGNDDINADDSDEGDDGYISLYSAPNGKAWHDLSFSQVKALARRARSHHNTGTANTQNGDATDNVLEDTLEGDDTGFAV